MTAGSTTGETRKRAPASTADLASSIVRTVPAPTTIPSRLENSPMRSSAPGVVSVNSMTLKPAFSAASIAGAAASSMVVRRMAEAFCDPKNWTKSSGCISGFLRIIA
jgi:hypothetical protein